MTVSRNTFDPDKNYDRVVFNEKRSILDSELNELQDIQAEMSNLLSEVGVGDGPFGDSYQVFSTGEPNEVGIRSGIYYNSGNFLRLPTYRVLSNLTTPLGGSRVDLVYIYYKFEPVDSTEDPNIIDPDIGTETATRRQIYIELRIAEGTSIPTVDFETEFIVPIARLNRQALNESISADQIEDLRIFSARNYVGDGLAIATVGTNQVVWDSGWGYVGDHKFTIQAGSATLASPNIPRKWYVDSSGNLTYNELWPTDFHVKVAETYIDPTTGLWTVDDKRRFVPIAGLPIEFPITNLDVNPLGTTVTINQGLVYVDGTDILRFPTTIIDLGFGGNHQLNAITNAGYYQKVLISLMKDDTGTTPAADLITVTQGIEIATRPDASTANPEAPDDELPIAILIVQDDGRSIPGSVKAITKDDVEDIRPFLNMGASPEIVDARGNRDSLGDRLDESLTPYGHIKENAVTIDGIRDLRVEPTTGQDSSYPNPSLRLYAQPGTYNFGEFAGFWQGGVTNEFAVPATGKHRVDLISLGESGILEYSSGIEVSHSAQPVTPSHIGKFPLAEIYLRDTMTALTETDASVESVQIVSSLSYVNLQGSVISTDDQFNGYKLFIVTGVLNGKTYTITDTDAANNRLIISGNLGLLSSDDEVRITPITRVRPINNLMTAQVVSPERYVWTIASGGDINNVGFVSGGITQGLPGIPLNQVSGKTATLPFEYLTGGYELLVYRNGVKLLNNVNYEEFVPAGETVGIYRSNKVTFLWGSTTTYFPEGDNIEFQVVAGAQSLYAPGINPPQRDVQISAPAQVTFTLPFSYIVGQAGNDYEQQLLVFVNGAKYTRKDPPGGDPQTQTLTVYYEEAGPTQVTFSPALSSGDIVEFVIPAGSLTSELESSSNWTNNGATLQPKENQGIKLFNTNVGVPDIEGSNNNWNIDRVGNATVTTINGKDPDGILDPTARATLEGGPASIADSYHTHDGLISDNVNFQSPPQFDSGWIPTSTGNTEFVFAALDPANELGLDPQQWIIVIEGANDSAGTTVTNKQIGLEQVGASVYGYAYHTVTASSLYVARGANDTDNPYIRVRVWDYSRGPVSTASRESLVLGYDSGWVPINPSAILTLSHNLGSTITTKGVVVLEGSSSATGSDPHNNALGLNERSNGVTWGSRWFGLTSSEISVERASGDNTAPVNTRWNYFRVRLYTYETLSLSPAGGQLGMGKPNFDSGWFNKTNGSINFSTLDPDHTLGSIPDNYIVDVQLRDTLSTFGTHNRGIGGNTPQAGIEYFAHYTNLTSSALTLVSKPDDGTTLYDQVRIRIWDTSKGVATPDATEALTLKYDSGYTSISNGQTLTLAHNIGEDPDSYIIDLTYKDSTGSVNNQYYGTESDRPSGSLEKKGIYWHQSTRNSLQLTREIFDTAASQCRVRIFRMEPIAAIYPTARYGTSYLDLTFDPSSSYSQPSGSFISGISGWVLNAGTELTFNFRVPGDISLDNSINLEFYWNSVLPNVGTCLINLAYKVLDPGDNIFTGGNSGIDSIIINPTTDSYGSDAFNLSTALEIPAAALTSSENLITGRIQRVVQSPGPDFVSGAFFFSSPSFKYVKFE